MGKVGSQSIKHSLEEKKINPYHLHWLGEREPIAEFYTRNIDILKNLKDKNKKFKVIVLVREPMARNLSAFFQKIRRWTSKKPEKMDSYEIFKDFIENYDIAYPDKWFKQELEKFFNINVYKEPFDHSKGYKIYSINGHDILIIRLENAKDKLEEAMREFIKISGINMSCCGVYENRKVGNDFIQKYKDIKSMNFPLDFINKNYNLKYSKHFYTKNEIESYKKGWIN